MAKWMVAAKKADFVEIGKKYGISPELARLIRNRDIIKDQDIDKFLSGTIADMYDPFALKDMDKAVSLLWEKIRSGKPLRVIGDYDIDGVCSSYILLKGLQVLGADVDAIIPHRIKDGYGLNTNLIKEAARDQIDTIITCDNGIAAGEQIALAAELGMSVIVTDHHEVPYEEAPDGNKHYLLPLAAAIVDPKREDCTYPFSGICGGMVALKVIQAMLLAGEDQEPAAFTMEQEELMQELYCFAAFATVGDVMELRDENRIVVKYGLEQLQKIKNPGMRALIEINGLQDKPLTAFHIGFVLGPCLNATGRLDTAGRALKLFCCQEFSEAVTIAADLKNLNDSRKEMTARGVEQAIEMIEQSDIGRDKVLVVYLPDCHESLAGIIAGRLREKYGKPAFVLTKAEEEIKGSGRSIEAYHMFEQMSHCKELFTKYGGHKLAAGLSMKEENLDKFRHFLNEHTILTEDDFIEKIHIDIPMPLNYVSKQFVGELEKLEPFGCGNRKPLFAQKRVRLIKGNIIGKNKNVGKYKIADEAGNSYEMIYFGDLAAFHDFLREKYGEERQKALYAAMAGPVHGEQAMEITLAYYPAINSYGGRESIQIVMQYYC